MTQQERCLEHRRPAAYCRVDMLGCEAADRPYGDDDYTSEVDLGMALLSMGPHSRRSWAEALAVLTND